VRPNYGGEMDLLLIAAFLMNVAPTPTKATAGATSFTGTCRQDHDELRRTLVALGRGTNVDRALDVP